MELVKKKEKLDEKEKILDASSTLQQTLEETERKCLEHQHERLRVEEKLQEVETEISQQQVVLREVQKEMMTHIVRSAKMEKKIPQYKAGLKKWKILYLFLFYI